MMVIGMVTLILGDRKCLSRVPDNPRGQEYVEIDPVHTLGFRLEKPAKSGNISQQGDFIYSILHIITDNTTDYQGIGILDYDSGLRRAFKGGGPVGYQGNSLIFEPDNFHEDIET